MSRPSTHSPRPWHARHARPGAVPRAGAAPVPATRVFADRGLVARAGLALLIANLRYWTSIAPLVREQLARWERCAQAIPDHELRALALGKLRDERLNVQGAATLATLAPRTHRKHAATAIVALQAMYDYLDLLTEQPLDDDGRHLYGAFIDALTPAAQPEGDYYRDDPRAGDGGYLQELTATVRLALERLPAAAAIGEVALHSATRCAEAQVRSHAAARSGTAALERWARREAAEATTTGAALRWPEFLAGATASVLAVHALIAAAADARTTRADAGRIGAVYLSIGALTMLDSLVDREHDIVTGELGYARYYERPEQMAERLVDVARDAAERASALPNGAHHAITLVGVVAFYASAPAAGGKPARETMERLRGELRPLIVPTLALMRAWRLAKRVRLRFGARPRHDGATGVTTVPRRRERA